MVRVLIEIQFFWGGRGGLWIIRQSLKIAGIDIITVSFDNFMGKFQQLYSNNAT